MKRILMIFCSVVFLVYTANAQTPQSSKNVSELPPGNIRLLENYTHTPKRGIDTRVGEISKPNGLTIHYDIGFLAERMAGYECTNKECVWYKSQKVNGKTVWIGLTKDGTIIATFIEDSANFFAQTKSSEDVADFLMMILTYGNNDSVSQNNQKQSESKVSQIPNNSTRLFPVSENGKWGYVDENGKMIIKPQFESASRFKNDRAVVVVIDKNGYKNQYGFIDKSGKMVIEAKYDEANDFTEDLALVSKDYRWGYIDKTGKEVIPLEFVEGLNFSENLAAVRFQLKNAEWGFINKKGETIIPPKFYKAYSFHGSVAKVIVGKFGETNLQGFIDTRGNFIVQPQFLLTGEFSEDLIPVEVGGKQRKDGERLYTHISGKWGYIDKNNKTVIPPKFDNADEFSEGLANVTIGDKYGYIDKSGKIAIEPQFEYSSNSYRCAYFTEGLACFERDGKIGFIDKTGKVVIEPQFDFAEKFSDGFTIVGFPEYNDGYGVIDKTGKIIWKPSK